MNKEYSVKARISKSLNTFLDIFAEKRNINKSQLIREVLSNFLIASAHLLNEKESLIFNEHLRKLRLEKQIKKTKEKTRCYFLIRNCYNVLFKLNQSFLFNSGKLNMVIIQNIIDEYNKLYDVFPEEIKKDLKEEIEELNLLKDEKNLVEKYKRFKLLIEDKQNGYNNS